jgi:hypothetical protein
MYRSITYTFVYVPRLWGGRSLRLVQAKALVGSQAAAFAPLVRHPLLQDRHMYTINSLFIEILIYIDLPILRPNGQ